MGRFPSFLQRSRHGTTFYFRRRVPEDLRLVVRKVQLYKSLRTAVLRIALVRARALAVECDRAFAKLRATIDLPASGGIVPFLRYKVRVKFGDSAGNPEQVEVETDPERPYDHQAAMEMLRETVQWAREKAGSTGGADAVLVPTTAKPAVAKALGDAVEEFLRDGKNQKINTKAAYRTPLINVAIPFFGSETALSSITQEEFARLAQHVDALDKASSTKELYLQAVCAMGDWHRARGVDVPAWTRRTLLTRDRAPDDRKRDELTMAQLEVIFKEVASDRRFEPAQFWVTVMVAFFGCRLEEVAQVDLRTDLQFDKTSGVHFLRLQEDTSDDDAPADAGIDRSSVKVIEKSIKTRAGWRVVPIHSALVRAGLIEFLNKQRADGFTRPFEAKWNPLRKQQQVGSDLIESVKWSHQISKWGGRYFKRLVRRGLIAKTGTESYFHSMRHSFVSYLARRGLQEEERAMLTGHAFGGVNNTTYTKLRNDAIHLSKLVESHLVDYERLLEDALKVPDQAAQPRRTSAGRPGRRTRGRSSMDGRTAKGRRAAKH